MRGDHVTALHRRVSPGEIGINHSAGDAGELSLSERSPLPLEKANLISRETTRLRGLLSPPGRLSTIRSPLSEKAMQRDDVFSPPPLHPLSLPVFRVISSHRGARQRANPKRRESRACRRPKNAYREESTAATDAFHCTSVSATMFIDNGRV